MVVALYRQMMQCHMLKTGARIQLWGMTQSLELLLIGWGRADNMPMSNCIIILIFLNANRMYNGAAG